MRIAIVIRARMMDPMRADRIDRSACNASVPRNAIAYSMGLQDAGFDGQETMKSKRVPRPLWHR